MAYGEDIGAKLSNLGSSIGGGFQEAANRNRQSRLDKEDKDRKNRAEQTAEEKEQYRRKPKSATDLIKRGHVELAEIIDQNGEDSLIAREKRSEINRLYKMAEIESSYARSAQAVYSKDITKLTKKPVPLKFDFRALGIDLPDPPPTTFLSDVFGLKDNEKEATVKTKYMEENLKIGLDRYDERFPNQGPIARDMFRDRYVKLLEEKIKYPEFDPSDSEGGWTFNLFKHVAKFPVKGGKALAIGTVQEIEKEAPAKKNPPKEEPKVSEADVTKYQATRKKLGLKLISNKKAAEIIIEKMKGDPKLKLKRKSK